jgi:DNA-binding FrmR family transcriptional regulator
MKHELHLSHPDIINRLRRANGHLLKVIGMMEEGRPCLDLAQQLHAVESAIHEAKKTLIHDHLDNCIEAALSSATQKGGNPVEEFKAITRYL